MNRTGWKWFQAALIRALKTMAQTALSMITVGMAIKDVDWVQLISISVVAGVYSILTSFATGLPETTTSGTMIVDTNVDPSSALIGISLDDKVTKESLKKIEEKGIINFKVEKDTP